MDKIFHFTFDDIKAQFHTAIDIGYKIETCEDYAPLGIVSSKEKILINRIDIDFSIKKAIKL